MGALFSCSGYFFIETNITRSFSKIKTWLRLIPLLSFFFSAAAFASGVQPETSVIIINEAQKGGSINIKNTENAPLLLYTRVVDLPDDPTPRLLVTQPVARLEPGQSQRVRFVLNTDGPLQREHIKRVWFEGVAEQNSGGNVGVTIRHDLPAVIVPKGVKAKRELWNDLSWSVSGDRLLISNTGKQVVRLAQQISLQPADVMLSLSKNYILPGETLIVSAPDGVRLSDAREIEFSPVTRYGFSVGLQKADLNGKSVVQ